MSSMGRQDRGRRGLALFSAVLALLQIACLSPFRHWEDQRAAPVVVVEQQHPAVLRVTKVDSTRLVVREPRLADSTLSGVAHDSVVAVPLSDIARVAVQKRGASAPVQFGAALVGVGLLIYIVTWNPLGS